MCDKSKKVIVWETPKLIFINTTQTESGSVVLPSAEGIHTAVTDHFYGS